jgi:restriction system protein
MFARVSELVERPTYAGFLWPTVLAVRELGGAADIRQIDVLAIKLAGLSQRQRSRMHRGSEVTEAEYRLAWARTALKGMGVLENSGRGRWRLTSLGKTMPEAHISWRLDMYLAELKETRRERTTRRSRTTPIRITRVEVPEDARAATLESLDDLPSR